ncbi:hypothetical protein PC116_g7971 [Phytophthora cactorum]|nr:hypothetical protein C6341_g6239 [Phytophthora cactorum]KAG4244188.1 hypothetical protein PC116_g7971 [Phytophthora cactorum]
MATSVWLPPRGQTIVVTDVVGNIKDDAIAPVEGATGLPPTLCVSRALGTVDEGKVVVDICNASTDDEKERLWRLFR